jgi:hypothetical protein
MKKGYQKDKTLAMGRTFIFQIGIDKSKIETSLNLGTWYGHTYQP